MAGRLCRGSTTYAIAREFGLDPAFCLEAYYDIAPTTTVAVVRRLTARERELVGLFWGLLPPWASDPVIDGGSRFNARAETIDQKRPFRDAFHTRRCLVPADAFYVWSRTKRQPNVVRMYDERPFALAGIWSRWESGDQTIESFAIVTMSANDIVRRVCDRMSVIVSPADYADWLNPDTPGASLKHLLEAVAPEELVMYPIRREVNDPGNDFPELLEPAEPGSESGPKGGTRRPPWGVPRTRASDRGRALRFG